MVGDCKITSAHTFVGVPGDKGFVAQEHKGEEIRDDKVGGSSDNLGE